MHPCLNLAFSTLVLSMAGVAVAAPPRPLAANHPLLGQWKVTLPGNGCTETYDVRPDGTSTVTSGEEVTENAIDVADRPDAHGAYRWVDKVVKSNGKKDCGDSITPVGDMATIYVRFDATGDRMALCQDAATKECIGPYLRQRPKGQGSTRL
jgi:hypothetical protein